MERLSVLLLTLPIPEPPFGVQRGNHQLFALFFKNYLRLRGEERFVIQTLPRRLIDSGTNRAIVDGVAAQRPDVVGFSLYLWNAERSIECARLLKEIDPGIVVVGGGPEVQPDNDYLLARRAFDFLVRGEGERPFLALLEFLLAHLDRETKKMGLGKGAIPGTLEAALQDYGSGSLAELPSLFFRGDLLNASRRGEGQASGYIATPASAPGISLEAAQKGIADIYTEHAEDDFAYLELVRGCPYSCVFCSYAKNRDGISRLPIPLALESIRRLLERDVGEVYLLAPTINYDRRYFRELLDGIKKLRREVSGRRTTFFSELKMELLTDRDLGDMIDAGFVEFEIGVQTLRGETALDVGIPGIDEKGLDRVGGLIAKGGKPIVDFILGLPGESYEDCIRTVESLDRKGLLPYAVFYHLLALPGSALRKTAVENGFRFSKLPPYQVLETDRMDLEDIRTIYLYLEHRKNHSYYVEPVYTDPSVVYTLRLGADADRMHGSSSVKTGSVIAPKTPAGFRELVEKLAVYVSSAPEVFHHAYVVLDEGLLNAGRDAAARLGSLLPDYEYLVRSFREARNYYDRYCTSLDYLDRESFSKKATFLINPFSGNAERLRALLDERAFDYAYGVRTEDLIGHREAEARRDLEMLRTAWNEEGIYSVYLAESGGRIGDARVRSLIGEAAGAPGDEEDIFLYVMPFSREEKRPTRHR